MWPASYWAPKYFAPRYWDKTGSGAPPTPDDGLLGGGPGYVSAYQREQERREINEARRLELKRIEDELAKAEQEKLLAAERLEASLQEEINGLRTERARLIRLIDDEEAMFVLLMARPFH